jgi:hypothetical protein
MQASRKHAAYDMVRSLGIAERGSVINLPHELEAQGTLDVAGPLGRVFDGFPKYHIRDAHCCPPPAQIRACGIPALGSYLG